MPVLSRLGKFVQYSGKRRAFAHVRFDGKSGAARSASDHRLFRQRPRQEPPERLKAGFVPLAGASRSIRSAYCLPPGMIVQHRALPLIRRKKLRLIHQNARFLRAALFFNCSLQRAENAAGASRSCGRSACRTNRTARSQAVSPSAFSRPLLFCGWPSTRCSSKCSVSRSGSSLPAKNSRSRKPGAKSAARRLRPGGVIRLPAGKLPQRQRQRRQPLIKPPAHDRKHSLPRRHTLASCFLHCTSFP